MIILDFLFKICYTPFQNVKKNGRLAAIIWLCPPLALTGMALLNILVYYSFGSGIPTKVGTMLVFLMFGGLFYGLYTIYITKEREVSEGRFPILSGIVIFGMIVGSLLLMVISLAKYR